MLDDMSDDMDTHDTVSFKVMTDLQVEEVSVFVQPACEERDIVVIQLQFTVCACVRASVVRACIRPDLSRPQLVYLCMDFNIIWHTCFP